MIYNKITVYTNIYNMYGGLVMSDYIISCCSTADLTEEHFNKRDIHYICFHYELDGAAYMDDLGKTINLDDFYKAMSEGADTKTSQINVDEYETYFEEFLKEGTDILHLTLSSGISGTINSANIAAETLKEKYPDRKIYVIDSLAASSGYGLLMDKVADLKDEGMGIDELKDWVIENRLKVNHWFFTTDLTFFIKGGRVSKVSGFVGNLLNICPLLNVNFEGKLIPREKIRTKKKVIAATVEKMINNAENGLDYDGKCYISMSACRKDAEAVAKLAANDTQKLNDKLEIALKKAEDASLAKTRFLNNMSHDIRTPMNAILGYAQLMENELNGKDIPEALEHLEKLQQSGNLLLSIINNVLDMARIESGRMEIDENYCRIEDVWKSLFAVFDEKARKKNIALHYTMNVEHEHVLTDVTKVKEIFVNILSNAIKYTPAGGSVMVYVDELPCDESGYMIVRIRISDTGIGMSQDYLTKIFEAFTREKNTTKSKIAGTGLGMSIVKNYVDLLGGTIDVESELGKGSTFTVTLKHKIADENYYVKNYAENPETYSEILKDRKILLAEDNDLNAEIAEAILERAGLKTERVEDGIQCVNKIEKMPAGTYDMILMDIQMPKMNGYKATQAIRRLPDKDKAYIPIVAMTANAFEEDKRDAFAAGMNGHIAKPI